MLRFLHPGFLYFLPLALVPIIIHLLKRKKAVPFIFPSVAMLRRGALSKTANLNILNIILMLIRCAAVAGAVFLLAAPSVVFLTPGRGRGKTAVFLDYSYSMNQKLLNTTLWSEGVDIVSDIMKYIPSSAEGGAVSVFTFCKDTNYEGTGAEAIKSLKGKPKPCGVSEDCGKEILRETKSNSGFGRIFIISDFCVNAFKTAALWEKAPEVVCFKLKTSPKELEKNFYVKGFTSSENSIEAQLAGASSSLEYYSLSVYSPDGLKINSLKAPASFSKIVIPLNKNVQSGRIEIGERDVLAEDNVYFFARPPRKNARISCFNGSPSYSAAADGAYFLRKIVEGLRLFSLDIFSDSVGFYEALGTDAGPAAFLVNASSIEAHQAQVLRKWVSGGGVLFIFPGSATNAENYDIAIGDMLPAYIYPGKSGVLSEAQYFPAPWVGADIDSSHFEKFRAEKYFPLRPREDSLTVLKSGNETLCAARRFGAGAVILFAVTANMEFSNLPVESGFPPLLARSLGYFVFERNEVKQNYFIGERIEIPGEKALLRLGDEKIPLSKKITAAAFSSAFGVTMESPVLCETGIYRAETASGKFDISVNLERDGENNLARLTDRQIKKIFPQAAVFTLDAQEEEIPIILSGRPLAGALLILVLLFLIAEVTVASLV